MKSLAAAVLTSALLLAGCSGGGSDEAQLVLRGPEAFPPFF